MYFNTIIWYITFGVLVNLLYDLTINKIAKLTGDENAEKLRFTVLERIYVLIIWPIFAISFIIKVIKQFNDKN
jgi:mannose/fructose/N-acetylgalactosamine-specific phosphotransferase system component IIC